MNTKNFFILGIILLLTMTFSIVIEANDTVLTDRFETVQIDQNKVLNSEDSLILLVKYIL